MDAINAYPESSNTPIGEDMARLTMLRAERSTWIYHWQDINDFIWPRRFRYLLYDRNKGYKRNERVINNKAMIAVRTLAAGMMAGITSPARPWFKLVPAENLAESSLVKEWLDHAEKVLRQAYLRSNIYNVLHELYVMLAMFGTACIYIEEDDLKDFRGYLWPVGQYCLATNEQGIVDTTFREFSMNTSQLIRKFGEKKCSVMVQEAWRQKRLDQWFQVVHTIQPNLSRLHGKVDNRNMAWISRWFERAASAQSEPLYEGGFREFPCMAPRWFVTGEDVYGSGPGMDALGDVKALFLLERRKAQAVDKVVNPPMKGPMSLKNQRITLLPGDTTYVPDNVAGQKFEPSITVDPKGLPAIEDSIKRHEERIWSTFYADLFLMMLSDERQQPATAREINEKHDEKMLQLGPVLDRIHDELLTPLTNRCLNILYRRGKLKPPPSILHGQTIRVEYISIMAQAQKLLATQGVERFTSFVGSLSAVNRDILDLPNFDQIIRDYADMLGIPADSLNKDDVIKKLRLQRQQAQAQQAQAEQIAAGAQAAKAAGGVDVDNLKKLLGGLGAA